MNKELEKVCEEKAKKFCRHHGFEEIDDGPNEYNIFRDGFKAAIESEQVKDHIIKNDEKVKALVEALKEITNDCFLDAKTEMKVDKQIAKEALRDWGVLSD